VVYFNRFLQAAVILNLKNDKTVKSFSRISNSEGGFNLNLPDEGRVSLSISFLGDMKADGSTAIKFGAVV
jgi:hypothetical protein